MNTKFGELFQKANDIILNGVEPKQLNIVIKWQDRVNLKKSPIISSIECLLSNLSGANGPLSINNLTNIHTNDIGIVRLHDFYSKNIHFECNFTNAE